MSLKRALPLLLLVSCHREPAKPSPPPPPPAVDAAPAPVVVPESLTWAFWTSDGLVAASKAHAYRVDPSTCAAAAPVDLASDGIVAENGLDRFVVHHDAAYALWDAKALAKVGPLAQKGEGALVGDIDANVVALLGCAASKTRCGQLHEGPTFTTKHEIERLVLNGKYLFARGDEGGGLTVFDVATGKNVLTRPDWKKRLDVHAWNGPDLAELDGDDLVVGREDAIEHIDLATGKTLGRAAVPGKTMAVYAPKSKRVAVMIGADNRVTVWDSRTHRNVRTFDLRKQIEKGADCTHCALHLDDVDDDVVWLTSAYTNDHLALHLTSGAVERAEPAGVVYQEASSATHRIEARGVNNDRTCVLVTRANREARVLPTVFCGTGDSRNGARTFDDGPAPGFSKDGSRVAVLDGQGALHVFSVTDGKTCTTGRKE